MIIARVYDCFTGGGKILANLSAGRHSKILRVFAISRSNCAPCDASDSWRKIRSLSRLSVRLQGESPTPFTSNSRSRISSLSITVRSSRGASSNAILDLPLPGNPETTANLLSTGAGTTFNSWIYFPASRLHFVIANALSAVNTYPSIRRRRNGAPWVGRSFLQ